MDAMRADVMTGRDRARAFALEVCLAGCPFCGSPGEMRFLLTRPYIACTGCAATTATGETSEEAAAKWNRRDG